MRPRAPRGLTVLSCWLALSVGCGDSDAEPGADDAGAAAQPADAAGLDADAPSRAGPVADAYALLSEGALERAPEAIEALDSALAADPDNGWLALYAGLMRFWVLGQGAAGENVVEMAPFALPALMNLERADLLLPDDPRVAAFRGLVRVRVGLTLNDETLVEPGFADLERGIAGLPAFAYFLRVSAADGTAADSEHYAGVMSDVEAVLEHCAYDRNGDGTYVYPEGPLPSDRRVCGNEGIVPHVWEGLFITFGDNALKAGRTAQEARALYESAKAAPNYADWPFAADLDARLAAIDTRAALYADADPDNDPPVWTDDGHVCTGCHQER